MSERYLSVDNYARREREFVERRVAIVFDLIRFRELGRITVDFRPIDVKESTSFDLNRVGTTSSSSGRERNVGLSLTNESSYRWIEAESFVDVVLQSETIERFRVSTNDR